MMGGVADRYGCYRRRPFSYISGCFMLTILSTNKFSSGDEVSDTSQDT